MIGGSAGVHEREHPDRDQRDRRASPGTVTVTGAASTGLHAHLRRRLGRLDVPNVEFVNLSCGGCFASVEETNHGGTNDSFTLTYNGNTSAPIVNGTNYTAAGILAALDADPAGRRDRTVARLRRRQRSTTPGFQVTFGGHAGGDERAGHARARRTSPRARPASSARPTRAARSTTRAAPSRRRATRSRSSPRRRTYTIPLRTPFALTGSATDADGDPLIYIVGAERPRRRGRHGAAEQHEDERPAVRDVPDLGADQRQRHAALRLAGREPPDDDPTRVFPDLQQILDNNTNADTGACPTGPIAPPVPIPVKECFAEFLPTARLRRLRGHRTRARSRSHFRFTARDGKGGVNSADTTLLLAPGAGPFLVTSPNTGASRWPGGSTQTVTWDVAGTDAAPISDGEREDHLSTDGGHTYPYVLAASTANDGSEAVTLPNVAHDARPRSRSRRSATSSSTSRTPTSRSSTPSRRSATRTPGSG